MICHVKTLDTWANRTWKWSEIMILTNIGWILKYKYLFNHPILSSLLRLHLYSGQYWVWLCDVRYLLHNPGAWVCTLPPFMDIQFTSQFLLPPPPAAPSLLDTPHFSSSLHRLVQNRFEICLARFDLDSVLGSSNRITETTPHQPMRTEGGSRVKRLKVYKHQSESN